MRIKIITLITFFLSVVLFSKISYANKWSESCLVYKSSSDRSSGWPGKGFILFELYDDIGRSILYHPKTFNPIEILEHTLETTDYKGDWLCRDHNICVQYVWTIYSTIGEKYEFKTIYRRGYDDYHSEDLYYKEESNWVDLDGKCTN